ncbi:MAG TPA: type I phosphomannose isomerase catalytic subunit [Myxococcota bacterium]
MTRLPPLPMRPVYVEKLWGGQKLAALPAKRRAGHAPPAGVAVGESWEVADLPEGQSTVDDHPICRDFAGLPLSAVVAHYGAALIGTAHPAGRFPILVKLLDAAEPLSVQVHPDSADAAAHPGTFSKDEAWLVVDAAADGAVLHGFASDDVTADAFVDAVRAGTPHALLRSVPVARGDVLHVSPGVVHAIGAGVVILEVQEPSDTTYRVWDFDRLDSSGNKRALHLNDALRVTRFGPQPPALSSAVVDNEWQSTLCTTRSFAMRSIEVNGNRTRQLEVHPTHALVLHAESRDCVLVHDDVELVIPRGGSVVLPASCGSVTFPACGAPARVIVMS